MSKKKKKTELPRPELNLTAMMDLVLNLIMFFVLISNFSAASNPPLELPKPDKSLAKVNESPDKVVLNVVPADANSGIAQEVVFGIEHISPGDYAKLSAMLAEEVKKSPEVVVDLRADRSLHYTEVAQVMKAISAAGVKTINMAAIIE